MSVLPAQRYAARHQWRRLAAETAACGADPTRDVTALKLFAKLARKGWLWPTEDRADRWVLTALQAVADAYAHQPSITRRSRLSPALAALARIADAILGPDAAPAEADPQRSTVKPYYLED